MAGWAWFFVVSHHVTMLSEADCEIVIVLLPSLYLAFVLWERHQASQSGRPPPSWNILRRNQHDGSRIYPAPSGLIGWVKDKYHDLRGTHSRTGAYEQAARARGGRRGLDPDEAWDTSVGAEADAYGTGGYYEAQDLGLQSTAPGRHDESGGGYQENGKLPEYGHEDMRRGREPHRDSTTFIGGTQAGLDARFDAEFKGKSHPQDPFGDHAEASSLRGVSPRPVEERR